MATVNVLYLENAREAKGAFKNYFGEKFKIDFVNNVEDFNYYLFSDDDSYDFIIVDLNVDMDGTSLEELGEIIPEFKEHIDSQKIPTKINGSLALLGYDYIKYVMRAREKTKKMIREGRVIVCTGHKEAIIREGLVTEDVFGGIKEQIKKDGIVIEQIYGEIKIFDRAYDELAEIDRAIQRVTHK